MKKVFLFFAVMAAGVSNIYTAEAFSSATEREIRIKETTSPLGGVRCAAFCPCACGKRMAG